MEKARQASAMLRYLALLAALAAGPFTGPAHSNEPPQPQVGGFSERSFYFARGMYSGEFDNAGEFGGRWAVDFPKADRQFMVALKRLSLVDADSEENAIELTDPNLRRLPFLYMLEVGSLSLSDAEAAALRAYLDAGGFLVIDDSWGTWAWDNIQTQLRKVFPDRSIVEIPLEHPIFHVFYDIDEVLQIPNLNQGIDSVYGGPTHEYDGYYPNVHGIFDDDGRLMVMLNWNTDLGDAWEWADHPHYPLKFSTYAFEVGINFVIYAMTY